MTGFTPSVTEQTVPAQRNGASVKRADLTQIPGLPVAQDSTIPETSTIPAVSVSSPR